MSGMVFQAGKYMYMNTPRTSELGILCCNTISVINNISSSSDGTGNSSCASGGCRSSSRSYHFVKTSRRIRAF